MAHKKNQSSPTNGISKTSPHLCTKISIRQLFYEMKEKFPTVPDHIVSQHVENNCHNSSACIDALLFESKKYPGNVYPDALRQSVRRIPSSINNATVNDKQILNKENITKSSTYMAQCIANELKNTEPNVLKNSESSKKPIERPNTLKFTDLDTCTRLCNRPTRTAPPPPTSTSQSSPSEASTSLAGQPINMSLNVIVSPVTARPPRSGLNTPNTSNNAIGGHNENNHLTSLTFTLHQPTNSQNQNASNENDVSNGRSFQYVSSTYDAQMGVESSLQITVAGNNNSSVSNNISVIDSNNETQNAVANKSSSIPVNAMIPIIVASPEFIKETNTLNLQILAKERLSKALKNDKILLETIECELQIAKSPLSEDVFESLSKEVEELRANCTEMAALVETTDVSIGPHRRAPAPPTIPTPDNPQQPQPSLSRLPEGSEWECQKCTFRNHVFLRKCEICEMPLLSAGNNVANNRSLTQAQQQNLATQSTQMNAMNPMPLPFRHQQFYRINPLQQQQQQMVQLQPISLYQRLGYQNHSVPVVAASSRTSPIVLSYGPNPFPPPRLTQQH